jgi:plasmid maintenance system antidote protein VapI
MFLSHTTAHNFVETKMEPSQIALPIEVRPEEVARKQTLGGALELCAELAGYALDKTLASDLGVDKAQFSRWQSGGEGIVWPKFMQFMDFCGNDAPLMWMLHQRGYDLHSMRKKQTEIERKLAEAQETIRTMERDYQMKLQGIREARVA